MSNQTSVSNTPGNAEAPVCGVGKEGFKCAIVSWVAPALAIGILVLGMRYPVVSVVNIIFVAFSIMALTRSVLHIRRFGWCGLKGHVFLGTVMNVLLLALILVYVFTAMDPMGIRSGITGQ